MTDDDFLVAFPTRLDWEMTRPPADLEKFPAPLVTSRDGQEDAHEKPGPVTDLAAYALARGWNVEITYAEGWVPHATTGKPIGPKVSWAVRLYRNGVAAVAVRRGDTWDTFWTLGDPWQSFKTLGAFKKALT